MGPVPRSVAFGDILCPSCMESWPSPAGDRRDSHFQTASEKLAKLRGLKASSQPYRDLLEDVRAQLLKRKDFVADCELWKELYFRSVETYPSKKTLCGVPFRNVCKHNHVLSFYQGLKIPANVPLLHIDTHFDGNPITHSREMVDDARAGRTTAAQEKCWDIGAAMTGVLLLQSPRQPRNLIWLLPAWIPDAEADVPYFLHETKNKVQLANCSPPTHRLPLINGTLKLLSKPVACETATAMISTVNLSRGGTWQQKVGRLLSLLPASFILDIDLDYFVSNGRPLKKGMYEREAYDVCSHHRVRMKELNDTPRDLYSKGRRQYFDLSRSIKKEVALLDGRLRSFQAQMRTLRKRGKRPVAISISDSTGVDFTGCKSCASVSNSYLPKYYAAYINYRVVKLLQDEFG